MVSDPQHTCSSVLVLYTIIFVPGNTTHHFVMLSFILILQNFMLQFFNKSAKQDCILAFYKLLCLTSHFTYFQVFEDLHAIWGWILIEELHVPINQRNICAISILPLNTISHLLHS